LLTEVAAVLNTGTDEEMRALAEAWNSCHCFSVELLFFNVRSELFSSKVFFELLLFYFYRIATRYCRQYGIGNGSSRPHAPVPAWRNRTYPLALASSSPSPVAVRTHEVSGLAVQQRRQRAYCISHRILRGTRSNWSKAKGGTWMAGGTEWKVEAIFSVL